MSKFTFICEDEPMPFSEGVITKRTVQFDAVVLGDVISEFELFLRGAGFNPQGTLDFIDDDYYSQPQSGPEWYVEEFETELPQENHSQYYFDLERNK